MIGYRFDSSVIIINGGSRLTLKDLENIEVNCVCVCEEEASASDRLNKD